MQIRIVKNGNEISTVIIDRNGVHDDYVSKFEVLDYAGGDFVDNEGRRLDYVEQQDVPVVIFSQLEDLHIRAN
jgi:hypothetical protein